MHSKRPALLSEDGAILVGHIAEVATGQFRASCHAEIDHKHSVESEECEHFLAPSYSEAKAWINGKGAARGFTTWRNATKLG